MKRSGPIPRRTPLRAQKKQLRAEAIRDYKKSRQTKTDRITRDVGHHGIEWRDVRQIIFARCGGRCEGCGEPITFDQMEGHHRQTRALGIHCPGNALALCRICHHGPEGHGSPTRAKQLGRIVSRYDPHPCENPVYIAGRGWVKLDCEGHVLAA